MSFHNVSSDAPEYWLSNNLESFKIHVYIKIIIADLILKQYELLIPLTFPKNKEFFKSKKEDE